MLLLLKNNTFGSIVLTFLKNFSKTGYKSLVQHGAGLQDTFTWWKQKKHFQIFEKIKGGGKAKNAQKINFFASTKISGR